MVSWKLSLLVLVAVFVALAIDVEGRRGRGNNRRNSRGGNQAQGNNERGVVSRRRNNNRGVGRRRGGGSGHDGLGNTVGTDVTGDAATDGAGAGGRRGRRPGGRRAGGRRGGNRGRGRGRGGRGGGRGGRGGGRGGRGGRRPSMPSITDRVRRGFVHATGKFGFDLYRHMADDNDNFAIFPLGVYASTTAAMMGTNGLTKTQIAQALHIRARIHPAFSAYNASLTFGDTDNARMMVASGIFKRPQVALSRRFKRKLRSLYNMAISNFTLVDPIANVNEWVNSMTLEEIPDLLADGEIADNDLIMIMNAFFFKGRWSERFDTQEETFTGLNSQSFDVEALTRSGNFRHKHSSALEASILEVPYKGDRFAMYIFLPDQDTSLEDVESRLSFELVNETIGSLDEASAFNLKMPKFSLDTQRSMKTFLQGLGVTHLFHNETANLRKFTRYNHAFITDIKHRAVLHVHEHGDPQSSVGQADTDFDVNRPFMFLVRDKTTGVNLFIGRYVNPQGDNVDDD